MQYTDTVFGKANIKDSVAVELINSQDMQRLKGVSQFGYFEPFFFGVDHTRFEHSLGVFILLGKYEASLNEQLSGLLHDISHGAFSHCLDYVLSNGSEKEQSLQDDMFENFIKKTNIPKIVEKHGLSLEYILDDENFPLKETKLPDLCADRIDYSLRSAVAFKVIGRNEVDNLIKNLFIRENKWVFADFNTAKDFAELFLYLNNKYWAGTESAVMFATVGDYIKHSLERGYISEDFLFTTDKSVLDKINIHLAGDKKLRLFYDRMNNKIKYTNNPSKFERHLFCKSRVVDPLFMDDNAEIRRVSDVEKKWKEVLMQESKPKEYFIGFEE